MRIKRVRLKNGYKRFFDLTIDLGDNPARLVALVGPNGSGKSSVLDGLLYHQINTFQQLGGTSARGPSYHSMTANGLVGPENIEIDFVEGSFSQVRSAREKVGKANTVLSFRSPYRYNNHIKIKEIRATDAIVLNNYGASDASSVDTKMEENYRRLQAMISRYMQDTDVKPSEARAKILDLRHRSSIHLFCILMSFLRHCTNLS